MLVWIIPVQLTAEPMWRTDNKAYQHISSKTDLLSHLSATVGPECEPLLLNGVVNLWHLKLYPLFKKISNLFPYVQDVLRLPQQTRHGPSLVNEVPNKIIWCLPYILVTSSLFICPLKLTNAGQSQPPSCPCFSPPLFMAYKRESPAGDITIDVHQGSFSEICDHAEMQKAEYICLTDSEGSAGYFALHFYILYFNFSKRIVYFNFNLISRCLYWYSEFNLICLLISYSCIW